MMVRGGRRVSTWAYVDSGAFLSVFREEEAGRLGIDVASGEPTEIRVGDGHAIPAWIHRINLVVGSQQVRARVAFARLGVWFNLLGRLDLFEEFRITFDERQRVVVFERNGPRTASSGGAT